MPSPRGCFKTGCFGCLGALALLLLILGGTALLAWSDVKESDHIEEFLSPQVSGDTALLTGRPGRIVLDMSQGDFRIYPAKAGQSLRVEVEYDGGINELNQEYITLPDTSWQYTLDFHRKGSGMRAALQSLFSDGKSARVHVYLPPDVPVELVLSVSQGGVVVDLGGLWLTSADIQFRQGGGELDFSKPLKNPMSNLRIKCSMGGGSFENLGNASPEALNISSSMGGAEVDFNGTWLNDCDATLSTKMGAIAVIIPKDLKVVSDTDEGGGLGSGTPEIQEPVLRLHTKAKWGEIEIIR